MSNYWYGWPYRGEYIKDCMFAKQVGIDYLRKYAAKKSTEKSCVVFDIDDTLVFGDPEKSVELKEMEYNIESNFVFILPPNDPIVDLLIEAKKLGFKIIILTARPQESHKATIENLKRFRIPYDYVVVNEKDQFPSFKVMTRKQISKRMEIALTIGDQITDLFCPGTAAAIKLPDPDSKATYILTPNF